MSVKQIYIQTNSPGELTRWVKPIVKEIKKKSKDTKITLLITPCQYATGHEKDIAKNYEEIDTVLTPKDTLKFIFKQNRPEKIKDTEIKCLYLGGDPLYIKHLSKRWNVDVIGYTEHNKKLKGYKKTFFRDKDGDLMAASINKKELNYFKTLKKHKLKKDDKHILLIPGSRIQHFEFMLPLYIESIKIINKKNKDKVFIIPISKFITEDNIKRILERYSIPSNTKLIKDNSLELMNICNCAITIPGTNNAEIFYLQKPMLIILPLNNIRKLIIDGLAGLIGKIPIVGSIIIKAVIYLSYIKKPYISLPNQLLKEKIVPEQIKEFTPISLANEIINFSENKIELSKQINSFKSYKRSQNIAKVITKFILSYT